MVEFNFGSSGIGQDQGGTAGFRLEAAAAGTPYGVSITGWKSGSTSATSWFRNRTSSLVHYGSSGIGLNCGGTNGNPCVGESAPLHGIDNNTGYDLVIFHFDQAVTLDQIQMGYVGDDSDVSIFAHTGPVAADLTTKFNYDPTDTNTSSNGVGLTTLGWELIGHHGNVGTTATAVNSANVTSSWWAIGAYTSHIANPARTFGSVDTATDAFKLKSLFFSAASAVPTPSTLALLAVVLLLGGMRRKQQAVA